MNGGATTQAVARWLLAVIASVPCPHRVTGAPTHGTLFAPAAVSHLAFLRLPRGRWSVPFMVPREAADMSFVLTNGAGTWDNNHGCNYVCTVKAARNATVAPAMPRGVENVESMPHGAGRCGWLRVWVGMGGCLCLCLLTGALPLCMIVCACVLVLNLEADIRTYRLTPCPHTGMLHIVTFTKREGAETARRANKWTEEKRMRVWTPPGYDPANPPPGGYPVLYMQDGQNMFEVGGWLGPREGTGARVVSDALGPVELHTASF